jgi:hypothetical protein
VRLLPRRRTVYVVHPDVHRIVKLWPTLPPERGDVVLVKDVDGLGRARIVNRPKIRWASEPEPDGFHRRWRLRGPLRVVADPA